MLDYLSTDNRPQEFEEHLAHCSDCSAEFEQLQHLFQTLKPKVKVCASNNFTINTIQKINKKKEDQKMKKRVPFYFKVAMFLILIATSMFLVFFNTNSTQQVSATPINQILTESIAKILQSQSMRIDMEIRTMPQDNFEFIGTEYNFVKNCIKVEFTNPKKWLIEKPMRRILCDGKNQYLDMKNSDFVIKGDVNAGFLEWLHIFFTPDKILEIEKERSARDKSDYAVTETKKQLILTVFSKAQGDFTNDYLKNSSVTESDNKRVFCFDKNTNQLQSFKLYIIENGKEILVMKTTKIRYDEKFDAKTFDVQIFENKAIKDAKDLEVKPDETLKTKTPEEIARYFFEACAKSDWEKVIKVYPDLDYSTKEDFGGIELIEIGKSFQSGTYPGYFVPYTIKFKSGDVKKMNLAVRKDNPYQMWMIDGGLCGL
jgi:hypothetical protein